MFSIIAFVLILLLCCVVAFVIYGVSREKSSGFQFRRFIDISDISPGFVVFPFVTIARLLSERSKNTVVGRFSAGSYQAHTNL